MERLVTSNRLPSVVGHAAITPAADRPTAPVERDMMPKLWTTSYFVAGFLFLFVVAIWITCCRVTANEEPKEPKGPKKPKEPKEPQSPKNSASDHACSVHRYAHLLAQTLPPQRRHLRKVQRHLRPVWRPKLCGCRKTYFARPTKCRWPHNISNERLQRRRSRRISIRWLKSLELLPAGCDRPPYTAGWP
ncbi:hypothetical protein LSAT2_010772 [Lamellibrachia satsuma]|nr:hypothetical protein LSAT2_010772 [Lamellibrachia satsuma]